MVLWLLLQLHIAHDKNSSVIGQNIICGPYSFGLIIFFADSKAPGDTTPCQKK
jgi:hypothetical protein